MNRLGASIVASILAAIAALFEPVREGAFALINAWVPFGLNGFWFIAGMIVGAVVGKLGVVAALAAFVASMLARNAPEPMEHRDSMKPADAEPPVRRKQSVPKRKTLFEALREMSRRN